MAAAGKRVTRQRVAAERELRAKERGDPKLTMAAYLASPAALEAWGVLEVQVEDAEKPRVTGTSVFWGLGSSLEADTLAGWCNTVHKKLDPSGAMTLRQWTKFARPPCLVTVTVSPERSAQLRVPADFPLYHRPERLDEMR